MAAQQTDSLLALLGLVPSQLRRMQKSQNVMLPGINSWFKLGNDDFEDSDDTGTDDDKTDEESLSDAQELQELLDHKEDRTLSQSRKQEDKLLNLTCAAMAVIADEGMAVYVELLPHCRISSLLI